MDWQHLCEESECPYFGQPTKPSCKCHKTREQMMETEIEELRDALRGVLRDIRGFAFIQHGSCEIDFEKDYADEIALVTDR